MVTRKTKVGPKHKNVLSLARGKGHKVKIDRPKLTQDWKALVKSNSDWLVVII